MALSTQTPAGRKACGRLVLFGHNALLGEQVLVGIAAD